MFGSLEGAGLSQYFQIDDTDICHGLVSHMIGSTQYRSQWMTRYGYEWRRSQAQSRSISHMLPGNMTSCHIDIFSIIYGRAIRDLLLTFESSSQMPLIRREEALRFGRKASKSKRRVSLNLCFSPLIGARRSIKHLSYQGGLPLIGASVEVLEGFRDVQDFERLLYRLRFLRVRGVGVRDLLSILFF